MKPRESPPVTALAPSAVPPNWFIYALGGGLGHLTRAVALARHAARAGAAVRILSNTRFALTLSQQPCRSLVPLESGIELLTLPSAGDKAAVTHAVHAALRERPTPDVLVVDTFPRGLAGELVDPLPSLPSFKALVHRDLNPAYVRWADLKSFTACYDLVLVPGEDAPLATLPRARHTSPWLVCDANELLSPNTARTALGISSHNDLPLIVVVGSGTSQESLAAADAAHVFANKLGERSCVRFVSCDERALSAAGELGRSFWPLLAALRGVDLLIGAGGYNTVHEARATATPLIAIAQPRLYDRQAQRLLPHESAADWNQALALAARRLDETAPNSNKPCAAYLNGASEAFRLIVETQQVA